MADLQRYRAQLPAVPIDLPPLEGEGLNTSALVARVEGETAEQAIIAYRAERAPESAPHFRRYYLQPRMRGQRFLGGYVVKYVWDTSKGGKRHDQFVGLIGERGGMPDLARAQMLIGAHAQGALLPCAWHLCEDRDGTEPLDMGRMDVFDLLRGVSRDDVELFQRERGIIIDPYTWDFHKLYMRGKCQGCGQQLSVLAMAYDIDSAECAQCGIRTFLSPWIADSLKLGLGAITGGAVAVDDINQRLLHLVGWMGRVRAGVKHLHQEDLPAEHTPLSAFHAVMGKSLLAMSDGGKVDDVPAALARLTSHVSPDIAASVASAARAVRDAVKRGGPFTPLEAAMAGVLKSALAESGETKRLTAR